MLDRYGNEVLRNIFVRSDRQRDTRLGLPALGRSHKLSKSAASRMGVLINILDFFLFLPYFISFYNFFLYMVK